MRALFRLLMWTGFAGGVTFFWASVLAFEASFLPALGLISAFLAGLGIVGQAVGKARDQLSDPEFIEHLEDTAEQISNGAARMATTGSRHLSMANDIGSRHVVPAVLFLFEFRGRLRRLEFLIFQIGIGTLVASLLFLLFISVDDGRPVLGLVCFVGLLVVAASATSFSVRRTRDIGVNPWWYLMIFVPPANVAFILFLLLVPTDEFAGKGF